MMQNVIICMISDLISFHNVHCQTERMCKMD